jgi:hypothetical protein
MGNRKPEAGVQVLGTGTPSLLAETLKVTMTPASLVASALMFWRGGLNTGAVVEHVAATLRVRRSEQTGLVLSEMVTNDAGVAKGPAASDALPGTTVRTGTVLFWEVAFGALASWPYCPLPAHKRCPMPLAMHVMPGPALMATTPTKFDFWGKVQGPPGLLEGPPSPSWP